MKLEVELIQVKSIGEFCNSLNQVVPGHAFWFKRNDGVIEDRGTVALNTEQHRKFEESIQNGRVFRRVL